MPSSDHSYSVLAIFLGKKSELSFLISYPFPNDLKYSAKTSFHIAITLHVTC